MKHSIIKRAICTLSAAVCLGTAYCTLASAAKPQLPYAYGKWITADPNWENMSGGTYSWTEGAWFWKTYWKTEYHYKAWTKRPIVFYTDFVANQGQTLTSVRTYEKSVSIETVSQIEVDGSKIVPVKATVSCSATTTAKVGCEMCVQYDLNRYYERELAVAAVQMIRKYDAKVYRNGSYKKTKTAYGFDKESPVITLVYR